MREGVIRVRIFPKSPLAPLFQRGGILSILVVISGHKSVR